MKQNPFKIVPRMSFSEGDFIQFVDPEMIKMFPQIKDRIYRVYACTYNADFSLLLCKLVYGDQFFNQVFNVNEIDKKIIRVEA